MTGIKIALIVLAVGLGFLFGLGCYTFYYAQGASYLSNDPKVCVNCHIMRDQYDSWQKASHHAAATCNDCHLPHQFIAKYEKKMEYGFLHSRAFTLQNFHEPIQAHASTRPVIVENCRRCHGEFVSPTRIVTHQGEQYLDCVRCHDSVGHGARN